MKLVNENDHSLDRVYHQTVKKVTDDFEKLGFNTAISQMMIFINECYKAEHVYKEYAENITHKKHSPDSRVGVGFQPWFSGADR